MDVSPNPEFIRENNLKSTLYPVEFLGTICTVYKQKKGRNQNTPSLISTEDLLNWSNENAIDMGMGDTCYPKFVPFAMDKFEHHLYFSYVNGLNQSPRIQMKFKSGSSDPVQGNYFLHIFFSLCCEATQGV